MVNKMKTARLTSCNTSFDANMIKSKLDSEGIECFISNENFSTIYPFLSGAIDIMVKEEDLERAKEIIGDDSAKDIICPSCGSKNIRMGLGSNKLKKLFLILIAALTFSPAGIRKAQLKCKDCGAEF